MNKDDIRFTIFDFLSNDRIRDCIDKRYHHLILLRGASDKSLDNLDILLKILMF